MAHLLRGKQAGVHNDLSAGLGPDLFVLDYVGSSYAPTTTPCASII
jgi:hypothetical protein